MTPGDIVVIAGSPRRWVVIEMVPSPYGAPDVKLARFGEALRGRVATTLTVRPTGLHVVEQPSFAPGQKVRIAGGRSGTVAEDLGAIVRVAVESISELDGGGRIVGGGVTDVPRANLVLENFG